MSDQRVNQQRLEAYLSAVMYPAFDVAAHMEASQNGRPHPRRTDSAGTSTPRDLNTRLKLLELYTLHILPRNEEWDYARDFINMSEVLDEERREAFLGALQSLREEKSLDAIRKTELKRRQEEEAQRKEEEAAKRKLEAAEAEERHRRSEKSKLSRKGLPEANGSRTNNSVSGKSVNANGQRSSAPSRNHRPVRKNPPPPVSLYQKASFMFSSIQSSFLNASHSIQQNPIAAFRYLLFMFALIVAFARRDVRERVRRTLDDAFRRVRQTIGMGTKVSYI